MLSVEKSALFIRFSWHFREQLLQSIFGVHFVDTIGYIRQHKGQQKEEKEGC